MKLLKGHTETVSEDGVTIGVKTITKSMQVRVIDLHTSFSTAQGKDEFLSYILKNCIDTLEVNGESFNPTEVADMADMSDTDTVEQLYNIAAMVMGVLFPTEGDEKK